MDKIASIQPALKSLRVPPIASEYQMASILDKLPELTKLDLISCNSISIEFADRVNNICKLIRKVRDCKGIFIYIITSFNCFYYFAFVWF